MQFDKNHSVWINALFNSVEANVGLKQLELDKSISSCALIAKTSGRFHVLSVYKHANTE